MLVLKRRCLGVQTACGLLSPTRAPTTCGVDSFGVDQAGIVFSAHGGCDAAGAKAFGYPNLLGQPRERPPKKNSEPTRRHRKWPARSRQLRRSTNLTKPPPRDPVNRLRNFRPGIGRVSHIQTRPRLTPPTDVDTRSKQHTKSARILHAPGPAIQKHPITSTSTVPPAGFEPAAFCSGGRRSIP